MMKTTKILLAVAASAALAASPVLAQSVDVMGQGRAVAVGVSYADLNLDSDHGAQVMLERLAAATMEACGASEGSLVDYRAGVAGSRCFQAKLDEAVSQLDVPRVSALYQNEDPRSLVRRW